MTRKGLGRTVRSERMTKTMKTRKTLQMYRENAGTPTEDTLTQFRWVPQGSTEGGTSESKVAENGLELVKLKRRLESLEEREDKMEKQNRRDTTRVRM